MGQLLENNSHVLTMWPESIKPCGPNTGNPKDGGPSGTSKGNPKVGSESLPHNTNLESPTKSNGWNVLAKIRGLVGTKKNEKLVEEESALEIGVTKFGLVPFTELALKKIRAMGSGPSEAMLGVTIYGLTTVLGKKSLEETQNILVRTTVRKQGQKNEEQRMTKRGKVLENHLFPPSVDRNIVKRIQNIKCLNPDLSTAKIAGIIDVQEDTVAQVLATKKVISLAFNELNYFFLGNCKHDVVVIELIGPPMKGTKGKDPKPVFASLAVLVNHAVQGVDHVISKTYILTEKTKTENEPQIYELSLKFQVWVLESTLI